MTEKQLSPTDGARVNAIVSRAIEDNGGDPKLLVPCVREICDYWWPDGNFESNVYHFVRQMRLDPQYSSAFRRLEKPTPQIPTAPKRLQEIVRNVRQRLVGALTWLRSSWSRVRARLAFVGQQNAVPEAVSESITTHDCDFVTDLRVTCREGRLRDEQNFDRGLCPSCLGQGRVYGH